MLKAGIGTIRIAEFAWNKFENEEGVFTFDFFDRFLDVVEQTDMKVIFCTPTATPPAWLTQKYPEVLQADQDGHIFYHGCRRHYNYNAPVYLEKTRIIVEELAQLIKSIDKRHLVSTVISYNPSALDSVAKYAPSLDYVGINVYGPMGEVQAVVDRSDYKGAFMITEWGPTGWWETASTEWKAPIEQTSEEKRQVYEERYTQYISANTRCLGSFVFLWGQKEERTPTWFSMFVEDKVDSLPLKGEKTPMVEAMQRVWTGKELDETAPIVRGMTIDGKSAIDNVRIKAGTLFKAEVSVTDKENDSLAYVWEVLKEATVLGFGGSYEPRPERMGDVAVSDKNVYETMIKVPGEYRLYVYVLDNTGFVSTANIPFQVID